MGSLVMGLWELPGEHILLNVHSVANVGWLLYSAQNSSQEMEIGNLDHIQHAQMNTHPPLDTCGRLESQQAHNSTQTG